MKVHRFFIPGSDENFNHLLMVENKDAYLFDPLDVELLQSELKSLDGNLKGVFITHNHHDHVGGISKIKSLYPDIPIYIPGQNIFGRESFSMGRDHMEVVATPGHTMDHLSYFLYERERLKSVICGDTIFYCGVGNCKNGGDPKVLWHTVQSIFTPLSDDVVLFPSHDYVVPNLNFAESHGLLNDVGRSLLFSLQENDSRQYISTIGKEKSVNPFFRCQNEEEFLKLRQLRDRW